MVLDEAFDDHEPRHSGKNLIFRLSVRVGMIPIDAVGMVVGYAPTIIETVRAFDVHSLHGVSVVLAELHTQRGHQHVDVIGGLHRRDGHAVIVQIGHLRLLDFDLGASGLVNELELKLVPPLQAQHGWDIHAVIDIGDEASAGDVDLCRLGRQGDGEDAVNGGNADGLRNFAGSRRNAALDRNGMFFRTGRSGETETKQDRRQRTDSPDFHSSLAPNMTPIIYFLVKGWARSKMGNAVASPMLPMEVQDAEGQRPKRDRPAPGLAT
ncbi:MAG TPA: hypothetical protein VIB38_08680 [Aestuariivirgaceae bacterium]